ncbi:UNVERIFIED_CONTAM: hypothetical protein HDU68_008892 [Siphonaria sp. JEL0065]|nr:hypothetical protein HDU68_008892 [Siphonaria sp. JEL0065]
MPVDPNDIKNKIKRSEVVNKLRIEKNQQKLKRRMKTRKEEAANPELKEERLATNVPKTLENTREADETIVDADDEEVFASEETDEFAQYFNGKTPKVLVTTSRRATPATYEFANEFVGIFPDAHFVKRGSQFEVKKVVELAIGRDYTDLIIINEDKKTPNAITIIHLPNGPTAHFKLTSIKLNKEIRGHGTAYAHKPELILNHFNTRLGHTIGRMFASLFPHVPEFKGRQVATFHNQRDFIFFRRHRYIFKDGKRCDLQELGPRFTLKLKWLQKGTFDTRYGDYEWIFKIIKLLSVFAVAITAASAAAVPRDGGVAIKPPVKKVAFVAPGAAVVPERRDPKPPVKFVPPGGAVVPDSDEVSVKPPVKSAQNKRDTPPVKAPAAFVPPGGAVVPDSDEVSVKPPVKSAQNKRDKPVAKFVAPGSAVAPDTPRVKDRRDPTKPPVKFIPPGGAVVPDTPDRRDLKIKNIAEFGYVAPGGNKRRSPKPPVKVPGKKSGKKRDAPVKVAGQR